MRAAIVFFSGFSYEVVVQLVTYVTDFGRVCRRIVDEPFMGNEPPQFSISGTGVEPALHPVK